MKKLLLLTFIFLTACGPSEEDKQQIATVACNVMAESTTMDGAMKIKEVNQARKQMGEPLFLSTGVEIQEAINWSLCTELVMNNPEYIQILNDTRLQFEGFWIYESYSIYSGDKLRDEVLTMQFINDTVELSRYDFGVILIEKTTFSFNRINDSELKLFNQEGRDHGFQDILSASVFINQEDNELKVDHRNFTRPSNLSYEYFIGIWSLTLKLGTDEYRYKIEITDEETTITEITISHDERKFKKANSAHTYKSDLDHGFIFRLQADDRTFYDFVKEDSDGVSNWGYSIFQQLFTMKRENSNYEIPIPDDYEAG